MEPTQKPAGLQIWLQTKDTHLAAHCTYCTCCPTATGENDTSRNACHSSLAHWDCKNQARLQSPAGFRCQRLKWLQYPFESFFSLLFSTYPPINLSSSFKAIITAPLEGGVWANSTKNESMSNDGYFRAGFFFLYPASSLAFFPGLPSASSYQLVYWTPMQILIIARLTMTSKIVKRISVRS